MKVAVIGGGMIGLGTAWALRQAGADVTVYDSGRPGRGASWAAGGMLAAHVEEGSTRPDFLALARSSQLLWPGFAADLRAASGQDVTLDATGTMVAVFDAETETTWRTRIDRANPADGLVWLDATAAREREPSLAPDCRGTVLSRRDGQIDPQAVLAALMAALRRAGVEIREDMPVLGLESRGGRVTGLLTPDTTESCDAAVVASGAWSGRLTGLGDGADLPVRPVKGQMACLAWDRGTPPRHVIWGPGIYAIPRPDGRLVIGASMEDVGFDPRLTAAAMARILSAAERTVPGAGGAALVQMWAGFRPSAPDARPIIGPGALDGLTIATGHHRNGILLAPVTAEIVRDLVLGARPRLDISGFAPARFWRAGRPRSPETRRGPGLH